MLAKVRTPTGATCNGVLQLEANFIDVKKIHQFFFILNLVTKAF